MNVLKLAPPIQAVFVARPDDELNFQVHVVPNPVGRIPTNRQHLYIESIRPFELRRSYQDFKLFDQILHDKINDSGGDMWDTDQVTLPLLPAFGEVTFDAICELGKKLNEYVKELLMLPESFVNSPPFPHFFGQWPKDERKPNLLYPDSMVLRLFPLCDAKLQRTILTQGCDYNVVPDFLSPNSDDGDLEYYEFGTKAKNKIEFSAIISELAVELGVTEDDYAFSNDDYSDQRDTIIESNVKMGARDTVLEAPESPKKTDSLELGEQFSFEEFVTTLERKLRKKEKLRRQKPVENLEELSDESEENIENSKASEPETQMTRSKSRTKDPETTRKNDTLRRKGSMKNRNVVDADWDVKYAEYEVHTKVDTKKRKNETIGRKDSGETVSVPMERIKTDEGVSYGLSTLERKVRKNGTLRRQKSTEQKAALPDQDFVSEAMVVLPDGRSSMEIRDSIVDGYAQLLDDAFKTEPEQILASEEFELSEDVDEQLDSAVDAFEIEATQAGSYSIIENYMDHRNSKSSFSSVTDFYASSNYSASETAANSLNMESTVVVENDGSPSMDELIASFNEKMLIPTRKDSRFHAGKGANGKERKETRPKKTKEIYDPNSLPRTSKPEKQDEDEPQSNSLPRQTSNPSKSETSAETNNVRIKKSPPPQLLDIDITSVTEVPVFRQRQETVTNVIMTKDVALVVRLVVPVGKPLYFTTDKSVRLDVLLELIATTIGKTASPKWKRLSPPNQDQVSLKTISYHFKSRIKNIVTEIDWQQCLQNIADQQKVTLFVSMHIV